jgi:hypothetical protein
MNKTIHRISNISTGRLTAECPISNVEVLCSLVALGGSNNSVNQCKSVSDRMQVEKTKPICRAAQLT